MGKATHKKQSNRADPISKAARDKKNDPKPEKDPKTSHLYTDDNPETTLHGTGFKDAATAHKTSKSHERGPSVDVPRSLFSVEPTAA